MDLIIECDYANIGTRYNQNKLEVGLQDVDLDFLSQISEEHILQGFDNRLLFEKLIENDEDILHDYLVKSGYIYLVGHKKKGAFKLPLWLNFKCLFSIILCYEFDGRW